MVLHVNPNLPTIFSHSINLKEIKNNSEETDFYEYFEKNWLSCCEMWQTKHRKNLFNFDTDTNNHLERFN